MGKQDLSAQQVGHSKQASAGIIDSQSVKTTDVSGGERGFDGDKKVNGRKRHILADTLGLVNTVNWEKLLLQDFWKKVLTKTHFQ